ncbi:hypothetical protein SEPL_371 [Salmonella phage SE_PL]|nr:hypothetical protein CPT_Munch_051 [Salmonella phage Munch]QCW18723.1 hypothetical protein 7t3_0202 [Salmonella phage 7t3]QIG62984.1 hypothetical protein SEPL_371 [Salmonella phage SE_PL]WNV47157.1 hypothetical protein [Klebsiella phage fENko-Kae01]HCH9412422.1 hypothetical protein [Salmonella enterica]
MKLINTLTRLFGTDNVDDWNDVNDEDNVIDYIVIYHNNDGDNECEPDYFLRHYDNGSYQLNDLSGNVIHTGNDLAVLKKVLKNLPKSN